MSSDLSTDDEQPRFELEPAGLDEQLVATVVQFDEVPDECTIHPLEPTEEELMTRWVTALEGAYVPLPDAR